MVLATVKGIFENGKVTLKEQPPSDTTMDVLVTFVTRNPVKLKKREAGGLSGKVIMADDFDEPLDELKDYM